MTWINAASIGDGMMDSLCLLGSLGRRGVCGDAEQVPGLRAGRPPASRLHPARGLLRPHR